MFSVDKGRECEEHGEEDAERRGSGDHSEGYGVSTWAEKGWVFFSYGTLTEHDNHYIQHQKAMSV